jgi:hypothetical protein
MNQTPGRVVYDELGSPQGSRPTVSPLMISLMYCHINSF